MSGGDTSLIELVSREEKLSTEKKIEHFFRKNRADFPYSKE